MSKKRHVLKKLDHAIDEIKDARKSIKHLHYEHAENELASAIRKIGKALEGINELET